MSPHHWYLVWPSFMMTSSNGNIFRVTGPYCGEFTGPGEFPAQRPVTRSFDVFFDLHLNKRLSKQSWGWWFETLSRPLWRHRNESTHTSWHALHQGPHPSWANCRPRLEDSTPQFWNSGRGLIQVSDPDPIWSQTYPMGFISGLRAGQPMTSISCCTRKAVMSRAVWGMALSWTYTKFHPKKARRPMKHTVAEKYFAALAVDGSIQYTAPTMDGTRHHNWGATVNVRGLDARIYQSSPCLRCTVARPSSVLNSVKWDSSLKIERLQCLRCRLLCIITQTRWRCLWSKVNLRQLTGRLDR